MKVIRFYLFVVLYVQYCKSQLLFEGRPIWGLAPQILDRSNVPRDFDIKTKQLEQRKNCVCVMYYLCDSENYIITNGLNILDIRSSFNKQQIDCPTPQHVCCKRRPKLNEDHRKRQIHQNQIHKLKSQPQQQLIKALVPFRDSKCGLQTPTINTRILTDDDDFSRTLDGEFPWMVAIFKTISSDNYEFKCAGSLIHQKVVLTALHCVSGGKASSYRVLANGKSILNNIGEDVANEKLVQRIIKHPNYDPHTAANDIALLVLNKKYPKAFSRNILCLPRPIDTFYNKSCIATGWGTGSILHNGRKVLKKLELSLVEHTQCEKKLRNTRLGQSFILHPSFICAGGEKGKDTCSGDGGGPLICLTEPGGNKYSQYGITSWGIGCAQENVPGVYTNVPYFYEWIAQKFLDLRIL